MFRIISNAWCFCKNTQGKYRSLKYWSDQPFNFRISFWCSLKKLELYIKEAFQMTRSASDNDEFKKLNFIFNQYFREVLKRFQDDPKMERNFLRQWLSYIHLNFHTIKLQCFNDKVVDIHLQVLQSSINSVLSASGIYYQVCLPSHKICERTENTFWDHCVERTCDEEHDFWSAWHFPQSSSQYKTDSWLPLPLYYCIYCLL